eukprot:scaffold1019_cov172-Amphora_coffeaeformis.AAC.2
MFHQFVFEFRTIFALEEEIQGFHPFGNAKVFVFSFVSSMRISHQDTLGRFFGAFDSLCWDAWWPKLLQKVLGVPVTGWEIQPCRIRSHVGSILSWFIADAENHVGRR